MLSSVLSVGAFWSHRLPYNVVSMATVMFQSRWRVKRSQMEKVKVESSHDEKGKKFKGYKIICNAQLEHERLAIFLMFKNHLYWNNLSTMHVLLVDILIYHRIFKSNLSKKLGSYLLKLWVLKNCKIVKIEALINF